MNFDELRVFVVDAVEAHDLHHRVLAISAVQLQIPLFPENRVPQLVVAILRVVHKSIFRLFATDPDRLQGAGVRVDEEVTVYVLMT